MKLTYEPVYTKFYGYCNVALTNDILKHMTIDVHDKVDEEIDDVLYWGFYVNVEEALEAGIDSSLWN